MSLIEDPDSEYSFIVGAEESGDESAQSLNLKS